MPLSKELRQDQESKTDEPATIMYQSMIEVKIVVSTIGCKDSKARRKRRREQLETKR